MYWYYLDDGRAINLSRAAVLSFDKDDCYFTPYALLEYAGRTEKFVLRMFTERDDAKKFIRELTQKMNGDDEKILRESLLKSQGDVLSLLMTQAKAISDKLKEESDKR